MDNQNQNPQPDYSFILNQPEGDGSKPPKQRDFKVTLIFILLGLLAFVIILAVVFRVKRGVVNAPATKTTAKTTQTKKVTPAASKAPAQDFLNDVKASKDDKAFALLASDAITDLTAQNFTSSVGDPLRAYVDFASCKKTTTVASGANQNINYVCNVLPVPPNQAKTITFTFIINSGAGVTSPITGASWSFAN